MNAAWSERLVDEAFPYRLTTRGHSPDPGNECSYYLVYSDIARTIRLSGHKLATSDFSHQIRKSAFLPIRL
jgi:hypothetical protein